MTKMKRRTYTLLRNQLKLLEFFKSIKFKVIEKRRIIEKVDMSIHGINHSLTSLRKEKVMGIYYRKYWGVIEPSELPKLMDEKNKRVDAYLKIKENNKRQN